MSSFELLARAVQETNMQPIAVALGYTLEMEGKSQLLKIPCILETGPRDP